MSNVITCNGQQYWANPTVELKLNGIRQFGLLTFEDLCKKYPEGVVHEVFVHPLYVEDETHEEGAYVDFGRALSIINRRRC
jgi:hypothetical protein